MDWQEIAWVLGVILLFGLPLAAVYLTLSFFKTESERLLLLSFSAWLEWAFGFVLVIGVSMAPYLSMTSFVLVIAAFILINTLVTANILFLLRKKKESLNIFSEKIAERISGHYLRKAFLVNIVATLTLFLVIGSFVLLALLSRNFILVHNNSLYTMHRELI